jgi:hypothetical protein
MVCARIMPAVSGLEQEFPGRVTARNVSAAPPDSAREVQALGFRTHGLVIRGPDGGVLWKQADHKVKVDDARAALRRLLRPAAD